MADRQNLVMGSRRPGSPTAKNLVVGRLTHCPKFPALLLHPGRVILQESPAFSYRKDIQPGYKRFRSEGSMAQEIIIYGKAG